MSSGRRKVTREEIKKVHNLIEQRLSDYMTKNQVMDILYRQHNIERTFTRLVWEKLEEENPKFFQSYHLSLITINQIRIFNDLLQKQDEVLSHQENTDEVESEGSNTISTHHTSESTGSSYVSENNGVVMMTETMHRPTPAAVVNVHGGLNNVGPFMPLDQMQHVAMNMLSGPNFNGVRVNGSGYLGDSRFHVYQGNGNGMESQPPVSSFGSMDSVQHQFNGTVIDDTRSSHLLRQFSHDVSPLDSTTDFNNATDTLRFIRSTLGPYYSGGVTDISKIFDQNFGKDS